MQGSYDSRHSPTCQQPAVSPCHAALPLGCGEYKIRRPSFPDFRSNPPSWRAFFLTDSILFSFNTVLSRASQRVGQWITRQAGARRSQERAVSWERLAPAWREVQTAKLRYREADNATPGRSALQDRVRYSFGFPFLLPPWPVGLSGFLPACGAAVFAGGP